MKCSKTMITLRNYESDNGCVKVTVRTPFNSGVEVVVRAEGDKSTTLYDLDIVRDLAEILNAILAASEE